MSSGSGTLATTSSQPLQPTPRAVSASPSSAQPSPRPGSATASPRFPPSAASAQALLHSRGPSSSLHGTSMPSIFNSLLQQGQATSGASSLLQQMESAAASSATPAASSVAASLPQRSNSNNPQLQPLVSPVSGLVGRVPIGEESKAHHQIPSPTESQTASHSHKPPPVPPLSLPSPPKDTPITETPKLRSIAARPIFLDRTAHQQAFGTASALGSMSHARYESGPTAFTAAKRQGAGKFRYKGWRPSTPLAEARDAVSSKSPFGAIPLFPSEGLTRPAHISFQTSALTIAEAFMPRIKVWGKDDYLGKR